MDKTAMLKEAEVAGVLAAFTDAGMMPKLASEGFDYLTEKVAENLGDSYTVNEIAYVTDALLKQASAEPEMNKTAEEILADVASPAIGAAYLAKMAGEITDDQFENFSAGYVAQLLQD